MYVVNLVGNHWLYVTRSEGEQRSYYNDLGWFGFQKFYVMTSTGIDLYDIVHVKVYVFPVPKMCILAMLGNFGQSDKSSD